MNRLAQLNFDTIMKKGFDSDKTQSIFDEYSGKLTIGQLITLLIPYLFTFAGLGLLVYLILGGFKLMTAAGDPKKVQEGQHMITNAFIGFTVIFLSFLIVNLIGTLLGVKQIITIF
jgi:fucose 4-O-acetylase-like acetyltransferase